MLTEDNFLGQNIIYSTFAEGLGISISREKNTICISDERKKNVKRREIHLTGDAFNSFLCELKENIKLLNIHLESNQNFQQTFGDVRFLQRNKRFYIAEKGVLEERTPNEIPVPKNVLVTFKKDIEKGNINFQN